MRTGINISTPLFANASTNALPVSAPLSIPAKASGSMSASGMMIALAFTFLAGTINMPSADKLFITVHRTAETEYPFSIIVYGARLLLRVAICSAGAALSSATPSNFFNSVLCADTDRLNAAAELKSRCQCDARCDVLLSVSCIKKSLIPVTIFADRSSFPVRGEQAKGMACCAIPYNATANALTRHAIYCRKIFIKTFL